MKNVMGNESIILCVELKIIEIDHQHFKAIQDTGCLRRKSRTLKSHW